MKTIIISIANDENYSHRRLLPTYNDNLSNDR